MGWMRTTNTQLTATFDVAVDALRWVAEAAVAADGGATWPLTRRPGAATADDLYDGTAGVLMAFAQARLSGITRFDEPARAAAGRLRYLARSGWMADPAGQVVYLAGRPAELAGGRRNWPGGRRNWPGGRRNWPGGRRNWPGGRPM
jgi:hypothetical protein